MQTEVQDQRRKLLFLIPTLRGGGAERVMVTLLQHLDRAKFSLSLVVVDTRGAVFRDGLPSGVDFFDLGASRVRYALPKIMRLIWRTQPDIVFSTLGHLNIALAMVRPLLPDKIRYVAREAITVSKHLQSSAWPKLWAWAYRTFYTRFDTIICQSADMRDDLAANYGVPAEKLTLINNPVDIGRITEMASSPPENCWDAAPEETKEIRLVAAGRLVEQKGFDLLIDALALAGLAQLRVYVLGEGPLRESLENYARLKGVSHQIHFIGFQKNPYAYMARADACVLSSRYEGFPNVILEALACGKTVIATPAPGGIREIAEVTGGVQLASEVSAEALSKELLRFAANRPMMEITLDRYQVINIVKEYEQVFLTHATF